MNSIDELLQFNKEFVEQELYKDYVTTKIPNKKLAIVTCMDTRLTKILYKCLNIKNGDAKIIKNAGGMVTSETDDIMRSLIVATNYLQVEKIMVIAHEDCGMCGLSKETLIDNFSADVVKHFCEKVGVEGIEEYLHAFIKEDDAVLNSLQIIQNHPLIRNDIEVRGFVINPETGQLREITYNTHS